MNDIPGKKIEKTRHIKALIFPFAYCLSAYYSSYLFAQMGSTYWSKGIWILTANVIQLAQLYWRIEYENTRIRTKGRSGFRNRFFILYLSVTIASFVASVGYGVNEIEKSISASLPSQARIQAIDDEISLIDSKTNVSYEVQISNLQKRMENSSSWTTIALNKEIEKLRVGSELTVDDLKRKSQLMDKKAELVKYDTGIRSLFVSLGRYLVNEYYAQLIFLIFSIGVLEICLFHSSDELRNPFKEFRRNENRRPRKINKEAKHGQVFFKGESNAE